MVERPEQPCGRRAETSAPKLLAACVLTTGIALSGTGIAGAEPVSGSSSGLDAEWDASWAAYQFEESQAGSALATVNVVLPVTIDAPIDRVFPAYSNFSNSFGRHPFLRGVLDRRSYTEGGADVWEFIALEDIPAGPVSIPGRTVGQQRVYAADHWYSTDTWDMPGVITHQKVTFAEAGDATTVTEHLTFSAPAALIDYTVQNGVSSHIANQQALQHDIENGTL
ncbi:polyketide cyclase / dehydrase and lipid transport family protein [Rhodococcus sp. MTM3W5.2]|uniref:SRPBCC family protein n=1 Tax=Rhodococcus sp. MTM3W5.2 TaxID=1805827 RepID=UPI0009790F4D|nr:SRPBCC family protein [Rhodococcus sp. MTM3W5.2]AQA22175.1 polyketide cyclase / dehydrase and lipid transport family protein [Rhodococcus sp. MTM3W5.2]